MHCFRGYTLVLATVATAIVASHALAQPQSLPVDRGFRSKGAVVKRLVKQSSRSAEESQLVQDYFEKYYFPSMAQASANELGELADMRSDLFRQFIEPASGELKQELIDKAFAFANAMIRGRYHRAVKNNAILLLGNLAVSPEQPLPKATDLLSTIAASDRAPTFMRASALVGLARHARYYDKLPPESKTRILAALAKMARQPVDPRSAEPEAQDWLREKAARALRDVAEFDKKPEVAGLLLQLVADDTMSLDARVTIGASLKGLPLPQDGSGAQNVLEMAKAIAKYEAEMARDFEEKQLNSRGRRGDSLRNETTDRYRYDTATSRWVLMREPLASRLTELKDALSAVLPAAGPHTEAVNTAISATDKLLEDTLSKETIHIDVSTTARQFSATMESLNAGGEDPAAAEDGANDLF